MYEVVRVWEDDDGATFRRCRTFKSKDQARRHSAKLQDRFPRYLFWVIRVTGTAEVEAAQVAAAQPMPIVDPDYKED
jgi:hypothetical protein